MTEQRKQRLKRLLQESRHRLYKRDAKFASPLYDRIFVATKDVWHISTNGSCIYFDPDWLQKLTPVALDFILAHQQMHIALGHIDRPSYYRGDRFHLACDIVANAHLEEQGWNYPSLPQIGTIYCETFYPAVNGCTLTAEGAMKYVPFDPSTLNPARRRQYRIDAEDWWDNKADRGENGIVVLSPADADLDVFTEADDTYALRSEVHNKRSPKKPPGNKGESTATQNVKQNAMCEWEQQASEELLKVRNVTKKDGETGNKEEFIERIWQRTRSSTMNWRQLLDRFLQEDVFDYSFTPPDRRSQDSSFFLPDYHALDQSPQEVWFFADTSGSIDDDDLAVVYSEIANALTQFSGGLIGTLLFFDTRVYKPIPFSDIDDLIHVTPKGGGGTNFYCIFDYVLKSGMFHPPTSIVVFTDGQADFPNETAAANIPVLWLFSKSDAVAPWGTYTYVAPST